MKELSEAVRTAELKKAELIGQRDRLMADLKSEFGVDTIEEAQAKLEELKKSKGEVDSSLAEILAELEELLPEVN